jgi:hypothetical protein
MADIEHLKRIVKVEFSDIVQSAHVLDHKLRVILIDNSFVDIHLSRSLPGKFGFHWECMDASGSFYRYDNFPDKKWRSIETFPYHFHKGTKLNVKPSPFPLTIIDGFRGFPAFVKENLKETAL